MITMLNILNQPEENLLSLILSRDGGLVTKKRKEHLLVINPKVGLWTVFQEPFISFFEKIKKPTFYRDFIANDEGIPPAYYIAFMEQAYNNGIITLSGRRINRKNDVNPALPRILTLEFTGNNNSFDYFHTTIKKFLYSDSGDVFFINLDGKIHPDDPRIFDFLRKITCEASDTGKNVNFSIEIHPFSVPDKIHGQLSQFPITFNFYLQSGKLSKENLNRIIKKAKDATEKSFKTSVTAAVSNPEEIPENMEVLFNSGIFNLGVKISLEAILTQEPLTASLMKMEKFARKTLEALDRVYENLAWGERKIVLNDLQRFVTRLFGKTYSHPCGRFPCGMGQQMMILRDDGNFYACKPIGEITTRQFKVFPSNNGNFSCKTFSETLNSASSASFKCQRCMWFAFCSGGCPALKLEKYQDPAKEDPRCRYLQIMFEELLWRVYERPSLARKIGGLDLI